MALPDLHEEAVHCSGGVKGEGQRGPSVSAESEGETRGGVAVVLKARECTSNGMRDCGRQSGRGEEGVRGQTSGGWSGVEGSGGQREWSGMGWGGGSDDVTTVLSL